MIGCGARSQSVSTIHHLAFVNSNAVPTGPRADSGNADMEAKYDAEVELHKRKQLKFTVIRPGGLTLEPAKGAQVGKTRLKSTRSVASLSLPE